MGPERLAGERAVRQKLIDLSGFFKVLATRFDRMRRCRIPALAQKTFCMKARALTAEILPDKLRDIVI